MCNRVAMVFMLVLLGCGEDPYQQVSYTPPEPQTPAETKAIPIPEWNASQAENGQGPAAFVMGRIRPDTDLVFEGTIAVPELKKQEAGSIANVDLRRFDPNGKPVIQAQGHAEATIEDGKITYKVTVRAPPKPGQYDARLMVRVPGNDKPIVVVIAKGDVE